MSEEDLNRLCVYVEEYISGDTLQKISPVKVDLQLKSIDIKHLGWNTGKVCGKKHIHIVNSLKMSLLNSSVNWKFQLLSVKCHIRNQNARLS